MTSTPQTPSTPPTSSALEAYLAHQRWFAGKGRPFAVTATTTLGRLQEADADVPEVRIDLVHVSYEDGDTETYQLPIVTYPEPVDALSHVLVAQTGTAPTTYLYDALHDKSVTGLWLTGLIEGHEVPGLAFHREPTATEVPPGGPSLVVGAEQSNTSVIFGDTVILKAFRKISAGLNPDIEIHSALAAAGSTAIAPPLGWLEGTWADPGSGEQVSGSLAMAQRFLKGATEGWELALTSVRDLYAEADLHADEVGGDFAGEAERLGTVTAQVHTALADVLPTDVLDGKELAGLAEAMQQRLERAASEVPELAPYADALTGAYADLARLSEPVRVQRVHGDFHLGQVMRALDGWKLLDFEGEPARPLGERRGLEPPAKDIAGMLRSFDYAARHLLTDHPPDSQLAYRAVEWAERNREAFLDGYARAADADPRDNPVLLRAFETDKAVYEVLYEARNRPTWLQIPLAAIARLAGTAAPGSAPEPTTEQEATPS